MKCSICDSESFENISGFYYCTVCSTQSQVCLKERATLRKSRIKFCLNAYEIRMLVTFN